MGVLRHNAHMKIRKDVWERAQIVAALEGKSMTAFVEAALEHLIEKRKEALDVHAEIR